MDYDLMNPDSNYMMYRSEGKNCHDSQIKIENILHSISVSKVVAYDKALADLRMGRQIVSFKELTA